MGKRIHRTDPLMIGSMSSAPLEYMTQNPPLYF